MLSSVRCVLFGFFLFLVVFPIMCLVECCLRCLFSAICNAFGFVRCCVLYLRATFNKQGDRHGQKACILEVERFSVRETFE